MAKNRSEQTAYKGWANIIIYIFSTRLYETVLCTYTLKITILHRYELKTQHFKVTGLRGVRRLHFIGGIVGIDINFLIRLLACSTL